MHLYHNNKAAKQISTNKICTEKQLLSVENSGIFRMCESEGARGLGDRNPPVGSRGKALVGDLVGGEVTQKLKLLLMNA